MKKLIFSVCSTSLLLFGGCAYSTEFKNTHDLDKLATCEAAAALQCEKESRKVTVEPAPSEPKAEAPVN